MTGKRKKPYPSPSPPRPRARADDPPPPENEAPAATMAVGNDLNQASLAVMMKNLKDEKPESSKAGEEVVDGDVAEEPDHLELAEAEIEEMAEISDVFEEEVVYARRRPRGRRASIIPEAADTKVELTEPFSGAEARANWPLRYQKQKGTDKASSSQSNENDSDEMMQARCHYKKAIVDCVEYNLNDDAYVKGEEGKPYFICKIIELFQGVNNVLYLRACWYYRPSDTVISEKHSNLVGDKKRIFLSEVQDDISLDCIVRLVKIARIPFDTDATLKLSMIENSELYYDQMYLLPHCSFICIEPDNVDATSKDLNPSEKTVVDSGDKAKSENMQVEMSMLDIYAGCGAMSTGLCLGSNIEGVKLVTKWAVDVNKHACESLSLNHPETEVRCTSAEDYLKLLEQWKLICASYSLIEGPTHPYISPAVEDDDGPEETGLEDAGDESGCSEVYEVEEVIDIWFGMPGDKVDRGLYFKVHWKNYTSEDDSWEPCECLSGCPDKLKEFILKAFQEKRLPLPGSVDVLCGGPPWQGISGFNRFRNSEFPLADPKNQQMRVYMDLVQFLKPRFVLMENVVDLFKFSSAHLGRYAFARLVHMRYQARLGLMAAGAYGLAQYGIRAFLWAALESEKLPQFPLPTHEVVVRGILPREFRDCFVGFEDDEPDLQNKLFLEDVISDLPPVTNYHTEDVMDYQGPALTDFQRTIRLAKNVLPGFFHSGPVPNPPKLYDHRPLKLTIDDYTRVCHIPKVKGANFRDLPGLKVTDNVAERDGTQILLKSGKPLVPEYALSFVRGTSSKPFGRLWWDETVATVVTRAEPHNQIILHPVLDRVLTIRENARLQGFPDFYQLRGPVKERYIQVGNAVAIPVGRALGHALALAAKGISGRDPIYRLPNGFPFFPEP